MTKVESNKVLTLPIPRKVEFMNRPYPNVKPGSVIVKTEIAAVCVDEQMYTEHTHEFPISKAVLTFSATQHCGKDLLYPHGLPNAQGGG